ncbi:MAG: RING finger domain-containing protein [Candidatus Caldarchaeum sp.]|nr:RING finger domain-containing protein [Candidatus Caldarchaeum sp.]
MKLVIKVNNAGFWNPFEEPKPRPEEEKLKQRTEFCVICGLELMNEKTYSCPHCGALGHMSCFDDWLVVKQTCPLCRRQLVEV